MTSSSSLPSNAEILAYIDQTGAASKNELARAFGLKGDERAALKRQLRDLQDQGALSKNGKALALEHSLPQVMVLQAAGVDDEGNLMALPAEPRASGLPWPPRLAIRVRPAHIKARTPGRKQRFLARIHALGGHRYEASVLKILPDTQVRAVVGRYERGRVEPADRRDRTRAYRLASEDCEGLTDGELVVILPDAGHGDGPARFGAPTARLKQRLGMAGSVASVSTLAIHEKHIPTQFSDEALQEAEACTAPTLKGRIDLRALPLVTVDGADARDFDDAIFAEPLADGGFRLVVAIADVSAYVPHRSALDREAQLRGNSCYFPDQVVPMLPEALSNGWCSLVPGEARGCLAVEIEIDDKGHKRKHRFVRGLMQSWARLTYHQLQGVIDGAPEAVPDRVLPHAQHLFAAYQALETARVRRGTLDLDVPERQVILSDDRQTIVDLRLRERLTAHKIIEEFMILANVCAAETLETFERPVAYRLHEVPDAARIEALRDMLRGLGVSLPKGVALSPKDFNRVLHQVEESPYRGTIHEAILRAQSQARYGTQPLGHFGLSLDRYAHFTSPIRRYADLTVHRSLIDALNLGADGVSLSPGALETICEAVSFTERRAVEAERAATERYLAHFHEKQVGHVLSVRVASVTKYGLFVRIPETGAEGIMPFKALPHDRYEIDPVSNIAVGRHTGLALGVGDILEAELLEVQPLQGGLTFAYRDLLERGVSEAQLRRGYKAAQQQARKTEKRGKRVKRRLR